MKLAYRNLIRHYRKNIHSAAIGIVTIVLLLLYAVNLDSTERQLASLPEAMEVTASVSNLNGSKDEEICISEERVDGIAACPEVEDVVFSAQLMTGFGAFTLEGYKGNLNYFAAAVNDIAGVPGLKSEEIVRLYSRQCGRILLRRKGGGAAYAGGTVRPKFQHGYGTGTGRGGENGLYSGWKLACERNRRRGGFGIGDGNRLRYDKRKPAEGTAFAAWQQRGIRADLMKKSVNPLTFAIKLYIIFCVAEALHLFCDDGRQKMCA